MKTSDIGSALMAAATQYPPESAYQDKYVPAVVFKGRVIEPAYYRDPPMATFVFGTLTIRCIAMREAVARVAKKYQKGFSHPNPLPARPRGMPPRKFSARVFREFLADSEYDNARAYVLAFGPDKVPSEIWAQLRAMEHSA